MDTEPSTVSVSEAVSHLGLSILRSLCSEESRQRNVFISPFGLSTALAMLYCGARGDTRIEMRKVFGYDDAGLSDAQLPAAFSCLLSSFDKSPDSYVLSCANSLAMREEFSVKDEYKKLLEESFRASLFFFEKETAKTVEVINEWVKDNTNGMITQIVDELDEATVVVLLNAVYFKGTWLTEFEKRSTRPQDFYNGGLEQNAKQVQMMHQKDSFGYIETDTFAALLLPYQGREVVMTVLLPHSLDGVGELENRLTPQLFRELKDGMRLIRVNVFLPKFRFECSTSMEATLRALGVSSVFDLGAADLDGVSADKLFVSSVVHKAVVDVNEVGTEAAAATVATQKKGIEDVQLFKVDHPFVFTIHRLKDDAILFLGKVEEL